MDNLPTTVLLKILNLLPVKERFKFRLVNKDYKLLIEYFFKFKNLVISDRYRVFCYKWFATDQLFDCNFIGIENFDSVKLKLNHSLFTHVKCLKVKREMKDDNLKMNNKFLSQLEQLSQLENLEISDLQLEFNPLKINFLKLKFLNLERIDFHIEDSSSGNDNFKILKINAPLLEKLKMTLSQEAMERIEFICAIKVYYLEILNFIDEVILSFTNLIFLFCNCSEIPNHQGLFGNLVTKRLFENDHQIDENFLIKLTKLKEVHLHRKELFLQLSQQRLKLDRKNFKLFYHYICLNFVHEIDVDSFFINHQNFKIFILDNNEIRFFKDNFKYLADSFPTYKKLKYNCLDEFFENEEVLKDFLNKFYNLEFINIKNEIRSLDKLISVLKYSKTVSYLFFYHSSLDQQFFNNLVKLKSNLRELIIYFGHHLNFDFLFLFKFNYLISFTTDQSLTIELSRCLLSETKIAKLIFNYEHRKVLIDFNRIIDRFSLSVNLQEQSTYFENLNELFEFLVNNYH